MTKSEIYLKEFVEKLNCQFNSEATKRNYVSVVKNFFSFCIKSQDKNPQILLRRYILEELKEKEAKTINLHRAAIVKFFLLVKGVKISCTEVPRRKEPKKLPKVISQESIITVVSNLTNLKHKLEVILFYCCGLRLCEIANLKKNNILIDKNLLWLQETKGKKERIVPIPESARSLLYEYIKNCKADDLVFGDISTRTFQKVVSNAFLKIGIHATPHMLRHSFATHQIMSGENPFKVQAWLGHSSIKTTQSYVNLSQSFLSSSADLLNLKLYEQKFI